MLITDPKSLTTPPKTRDCARAVLWFHKEKDHFSRFWWKKNLYNWKKSIGNIPFLIVRMSTSSKSTTCLYYTPLVLRNRVKLLSQQIASVLLEYFFLAINTPDSTESVLRIWSGTPGETHIDFIIGNYFVYTAKTWKLNTFPTPYELKTCFFPVKI